MEGGAGEGKAIQSYSWESGRRMTFLTVLSSLLQVTLSCRAYRDPHNLSLPPRSPRAVGGSVAYPAQASGSPAASRLHALEAGGDEVISSTRDNGDARSGILRSRNGAAMHVGVRDAGQ